MIELTRENYFLTREYEGRPIIHSSCLEHIYPGQGGSLKRLALYFEEDQKKEEKAYQTTGRILHKYLENKNTFAIDSNPRPEEGVVRVIDHMFENWAGHAIPRVPDSWPIIGALMIDSAKALGYQPRWNPETIIKKIGGDGAGYWKFLCEAEGKHILTPAQKVQFEGMSQSLLDSPDAEFIFSKEAQHEVPILFKTEYGIMCKALLDWVILPDDPMEEIVIIDYKTTSKPLGNFRAYETIGFGTDGEGRHEWAPGPFFTYRYYRQLAFYYRAVVALFGERFPDWKKRLPNIRTYILPVESKPPFECNLLMIDPSEIAMGDREIANCFIDIKGFLEQQKKF